VVNSPNDLWVTTPEAAILLNVSVDYMNKILDRGDLPFKMYSIEDGYDGPDERLIERKALLEYREKRYQRREQALADLARISQELGLYDIEE
jgi:hypothetical protein